jgi:hypothetical protein
MLKTPVVFIIFNRPELTKKVFETIREAKPKQLLVIADGARFPEEVEKCQQTKAIINDVDWNCEVLTNFSETNLGCRKRVYSGLDWVFSQVEEAIILEDDCLPHPSFFRYCETLLNYYRHDERIMVVSGDNFQDGQQRTHYSYYFSKYSHCWGWATWRRAWQYWNFNSEKWIEFRDAGLMKYVCDDPDEERYWVNIFNNLFLEGKPDSWAYAWTFACWSQSGLTILPNTNLVSNIGFGDDATHTFGENTYSKMATQDVGEIAHPPFILNHHEADQYTFNRHFGGLQIKQNQQIYMKIRRKVSSIKNNIRSCLIRKDKIEFKY